MSEQEKIQKAKIAPNKFVTMVWFIPLIALMIGAWMIIQNVKEIGPEVVLHMSSADGIEVNKTTVKVLSVDVGRVTKIKLNEDKTSVNVYVQLNADVKGLLREDSQFWVVKPRIDQGGVQGLGTLLSGAYIEFSPGSKGNEVFSFDVLPDPPITASHQEGLRLEVASTASKLIPVGNPVLYRDVTVGRIEKAKFNPEDQKTHYIIFIDKPYDSLVHSNSNFWITSGLDIKAGPDGLKIRSGSLPSLIGGAISFGTKEGAAPGKQLKQDSLLTLYPDIDKVQLAHSERAINYIILFDSSVRGLVADAPVEYKGIRVGSVTQVPFYDKDKSLNIFREGKIPALIRIDPELLEINAEKQDKAYWEKELESAIQKGLSAKLQNNSLIMGGLYVDLAINQKAAPTGQKVYAGYNVMPSVSGGLDQLQDQVSALLDKLNKLPLENSVQELNATLKELRQLTSSVNKLASSNETQNIPKELNNTLREMKKTLQGVSSESPIYGEIQKTLNSLNRTLEQIDPTIKTLNEQPNALIFNKKNKDPIPKGRK